MPCEQMGGQGAGCGGEVFLVEEDGDELALAARVWVVGVEKRGKGLGRGLAGGGDDGDVGTLEEGGDDGEADSWEWLAGCSGLCVGF